MASVGWVRALTMPIYALGELVPTIDPTAFIHPDAVIIGNVTIGPESSVWPCAVLRGDHGRVTVGAQTSIQDGAIIHCSSKFDTSIGNRCVVGHSSHIEGSTIHDDSLIGSNAVVLHGAEVGPVALVGASALVGNGKIVPQFARALGIPATITEGVVAVTDIEHGVAIYVRNSHWYRKDLRRID